MAELLATISSLELSEWMEFYSIEPFGEERADLRTGIIASTVINSVGGIDGKAAQPYDYMPFHETQTASNESNSILEADPEVQSALIMAAMFGIAPGEQ